MGRPAHCGNRYPAYSQIRMSRAPLQLRKSHHHTAVTTHVLRQRAGVPYEVERVVCGDCRQVLGERLVRRAAA